MTRKEFIKICGALGIVLPVAPSLLASNLNDKSDKRGLNRKVIIIGAGPAGLSSGYLLNQQGIDFEIIEASAHYGGRIRHNTEFTDFPIPLGAEWLHSDLSEFDKIVNDPSVQITTKMQEYSKSDTIGYFDEGTYAETTEGWFGVDEDLKFKGSSWMAFFEEYIVPSVQDKIILNAPVTSINYEGDEVIITTQKGKMYKGDEVIVTVPIQILKDGDIEFTPSLPKSKLEVLKEAYIWGGMKVFIEFSKKFYPTFLTLHNSHTVNGQQLYYDAAYGQNSKSNILGLFLVGLNAVDYQKKSDNELKEYILKELDGLYGGQASKYYVKHLVQNWSKEPYIRQAYLADYARARTSRILAKPIGNKVFFAGDAYTSFADWSSVHIAARSAREAVSSILEL